MFHVSLEGQKVYQATQGTMHIKLTTGQKHDYMTKSSLLATVSEAWWNEISSTLTDLRSFVGSKQRFVSKKHS